MTLQEFIDQYGTYVQVGLQDVFLNNYVYNVTDIVASPTLFAEISSGTLVIYAAYSNPVADVPPPPPPVPTLTPAQQQAQIVSLLQASRITFEALQEQFTGVRDFLLAAPYLIAFDNIAYPTPLSVGQLSSTQDPRLTDGQADFQFFVDGQSINLEQVQPIYIEIDGPNIQATTTIPLPNYARVLDLQTLSIQVLNLGYPLPVISVNLNVTSTVSHLSYVVPYDLTPVLATPVQVDSLSYEEMGLNSFLYEFQGNGIGPVDTIFEGEPIQNYEVTTVTFILTTPYNATQTFIDNARAEFQTQEVTSSPVFGNPSIGSDGMVGEAYELAIWSGNDVLNGYTNILWDPILDTFSVGTITLNASGYLGVGVGVPTYALEVSGDASISGNYYGDASGLTNLPVVENREVYIVGTPNGNYNGSTTIFNLIGNYVTNGKNLTASVNGLVEDIVYDYNETGPSTVTFISGLNNGDRVSFRWTNYS